MKSDEIPCGRDEIPCCCGHPLFVHKGKECRVRYLEVRSDSTDWPKVPCHEALSSNVMQGDIVGYLPFGMQHDDYFELFFYPDELYSLYLTWFSPYKHEHDRRYLWAVKTMFEYFQKIRNKYEEKE